jgi:DNA polymerase I-like protein with 3'-5' exonuclease and polymerase domains
MVESGVMEFYRNRMHPVIFPLLDMELKGVRFDTERRNYWRRVYRNQLKMLQERLTREVGHELNTASHKQMVDWLYKELELSKQYKLNKTTGNKGLTADAEAIKKLQEESDHPGLKTVLDIREKNKIYTTYLGVRLDPDKRIRCSYNLTGTETGRLSSSATLRGTGTNLQNIPEGIVKQLFLADPGKVLINADLSQAEARVVAYLAREQRLIDVFDSGGDIHRKNAANIFNKAEEEVNKDERQLAKRVVHACFAKGTEVLTPAGWCNIESVAVGDTIANYDGKKGTIKFLSVEETYSYKCPNKLIDIQGSNMWQLVTENHRVPYMTNGSVKVCRADELMPSYRIPLSGMKTEGECLQEEHIQLLVAIQADGSFSGNKVRFHLKKPRKIARLLHLLSILGVDYSISDYQNGTVGISFYHIEYVGLLSAAKQFTWNILNLNAQCLQVFINELPFWDGCKQETSQRYDSKHLINCEIVQAAAHLCGWRGRLKKSWCRKVWSVSLAKQRYSRITYISGRRKKELLPKSVHCVKVPTGLLITRRNKHVSISGNSNYGMGPRTFAKTTGICEREAKRLLNRYFATYPRIKIWQMQIQDRLKKTRTLVTPMGRQRTFYSRWSDQLYKEGLAYIPQSTVADIVSEGLCMLHNQGLELLLQVHDSIVVQCRASQVAETISQMKKAMEVPVEIEGKILTIPTDFKVGPNWEDMKDWQA